jgi:hypothetical protein
MWVLTFLLLGKMQLHAFVFDEAFKTLQGHGVAMDLAPWYRQPGISILKLSSVCGSDEEVALVDSHAQVLIFSFVTQQMRCVSCSLIFIMIGSLLNDCSDVGYQTCLVTAPVTPPCRILISGWFLPPCSSDSGFATFPHCLSLGDVWLHQWDILADSNLSA